MIMPGLFQSAVYIEATVNIVSGASFMLHPRWWLSRAMFKPRWGMHHIPANTVTLWMLFGGMVIAHTAPLMHCIRKPAAGVEVRRLVYRMLAADDLFYICFLFERFIYSRSGLTQGSLVNGIAFLIWRLSWHVYVLHVRPELLEEEFVDVMGSKDGAEEKDS